MPILTLTARRYRPSQQAGVSSTASMPSAAAERKMAPRLVGFIMFSNTAIRRAPEQMAPASGSFGLRMAQSTPRVSGKPVSWVRMLSSAV